MDAKTPSDATPATNLAEIGSKSVEPPAVVAPAEDGEKCGHAGEEWRECSHCNPQSGFDKWYASEYNTCPDHRAGCRRAWNAAIDQALASVAGSNA